MITNNDMDEGGNKKNGQNNQQRSREEKYSGNHLQCGLIVGFKNWNIYSTMILLIILLATQPTQGDIRNTTRQSLYRRFDHGELSLCIRPLSKDAMVVAKLEVQAIASPFVYQVGNVTLENMDIKKWQTANVTHDEQDSFHILRTMLNGEPVKFNKPASKKGWTLSTEFHQILLYTKGALRIEDCRQLPDFVVRPPARAAPEIPSAKSSVITPKKIEKKERIPVIPRTPRIEEKLPTTDNVVAPVKRIELEEKTSIKLKTKGRLKYVNPKRYGATTSKPSSNLGKTTTPKIREFTSAMPKIDVRNMKTTSGEIILPIIKEELTSANPIRNKPIEVQLISANPKRNRYNEEEHTTAKPKGNRYIEEGLISAKPKRNRYIEVGFTSAKPKRNRPIEEELISAKTKTNRPIEKGLTSAKPKRNRPIEEELTSAKPKRNRPIGVEHTSANPKKTRPVWTTKPSSNYEKMTKQPTSEVIKFKLPEVTTPDTSAVKTKSSWIHKFGSLGSVPALPLIIGIVGFLILLSLILVFIHKKKNSQKLRMKGERPYHTIPSSELGLPKDTVIAFDKTSKTVTSSEPEEDIGNSRFNRNNLTSFKTKQDQQDYHVSDYHKPQSLNSTTKKD